MLVKIWSYNVEDHKKYNEKEYIICRVYLARDATAFPDILNNFDLYKILKINWLLTVMIKIWICGA